MSSDCQESQESFKRQRTKGYQLKFMDSQSGKDRQVRNMEQTISELAVLLEASRWKRLHSNELTIRSFRALAEGLLYVKNWPWDSADPSMVEKGPRVICEGESQNFSGFSTKLSLPDSVLGRSFLPAESCFIRTMKVKVLVSQACPTL